MFLEVIFHGWLAGAAGQSLFRLVRAHWWKAVIRSVCTVCAQIRSDAITRVGGEGGYIFRLAGRGRVFPFQSGGDCANVIGLSARRQWPMPLRESEAIVLRTYRLGEADKIVSLLSREAGRVRAVAAGAQRPRSRYGGVLEPLTYIRLWFYERENRDLLRVNSAELIESFFAMQRDYAVHLAAQYVAEATESLLPEREVSERAFRLILAVLRGLRRQSEAKGPALIDPPLAYFNYWLLRLGGFLPQLDRCSGCGKAFGPDLVAFRETGSLRLICSECRASSSAPGVSGAALAAARRAQRLPLDKWTAGESQPAVREVRLLLESWVETAAEKRLLTRDLLAEEEPGA